MANIYGEEPTHPHYHNRSTLKESYDIYVASVKDTGEYIKSFDEWLDS